MIIPSVNVTEVPGVYTTPLTVNWVTDNALFSVSVSLLINPLAAVTFKVVSSSTALISGVATGASLIGLTVISKVEVAVFVPSETL